MIFEVDLGKSIDRMEWSFIKETLMDVGLPNLRIDTIFKCVTSGLFRLLWNGQVTDRMIPTTE